MQINPHCSCACSLCVHEHVSNEDLDNDTLSFRNALLIDARYHHAWYGLGNEICRQEKYHLATYHFHQALSAHSTSSTLSCYLATSQHDNHQMHDALNTLDVAINNDNATRSSDGTLINPQARFQRATMHIKSHRHHEVLIELEHAKSIALRESSVYFHI